jgi:hypothetical protein
VNLKKYKEPRHVTAGAWSGLAAPAIFAGAAAHSTAPWYIAVPLVIVGLGLAYWRRRRGGGGSSGRGPFGGSLPTGRADVLGCFSGAADKDALPEGSGARP